MAKPTQIKAVEHIYHNEMSTNANNKRGETINPQMNINSLLRVGFPNVLLAREHLGLNLTLGYLATRYK